MLRPEFCPSGTKPEEVIETSLQIAEGELQVLWVSLTVSWLNSLPLSHTTHRLDHREHVLTPSQTAEASLDRYVSGTRVDTTSYGHDVCITSRDGTAVLIAGADVGPSGTRYHLTDASLVGDLTGGGGEKQLWLLYSITAIVREHVACLYDWWDPEDPSMPMATFELASGQRVDDNQIGSRCFPASLLVGCSKYVVAVKYLFPFVKVELVNEERPVDSVHGSP